jgi:hypothetical protein
LVWSGVRLLSLSESYYPPNGDYAGAPKSVVSNTNIIINIT